VQDQGVTRLGSGNWIMAYVHIAHDCQLGDDIIMANNASLAGHVHIGDHAILGGFSLVHQFCKVGKFAFLQFAAGVNRDVPPYVVAAGMPATPHSINSEGLRRRGFSAQQIATLKQAYRLLYRSGLRLEEAREQIAHWRRIIRKWRYWRNFWPIIAAASSASRHEASAAYRHGRR